MRTLGSYMIIGALGSTALSFFGYNFKLLMWIDMWGETVGWVIRASLLVVGLIMFGIAKPEEKKEEELPEGMEEALAKLKTQSPS